jgi:hypothetical protein
MLYQASNGIRLIDSNGVVMRKLAVGRCGSVV